MADRESGEYAARVHAILAGQDAPDAANGGRRVLYRCPLCGRAWLMDGARVELTLSGERLAALAVELHADTGALPYATCRICGATHDIGTFDIDEYGAGRGYGFSWEGVTPTGAHLIATVLSEAYIAGLRVAPRAGIVTRPATCSAVLAWLATLKTPTSYRRYTPADRDAMAASNPPGHGAPGTDGWIWQGVTFTARCDALTGRVLVNLAQAMPPGAPFSASLMLATWRELARIMQAGSIAGEENTDGEGIGK